MATTSQGRSGLSQRSLSQGSVYAIHSLLLCCAVKNGLRHIFAKGKTVMVRCAKDFGGCRRGFEALAEDNALEVSPDAVRSRCGLHVKRAGPLQESLKKRAKSAVHTGNREMSVDHIVDQVQNRSLQAHTETKIAGQKKPENGNQQHENRLLISGSSKQKAPSSRKPAIKPRVKPKSHKGARPTVISPLKEQRGMGS